jgi:hypothetical protein
MTSVLHLQRPKPLCLLERCGAWRRTETTSAQALAPTTRLTYSHVWIRRDMSTLAKKKKVDLHLDDQPSSIMCATWKREISMCL